MKIKIILIIGCLIVFIFGFIPALFSEDETNKVEKNKEVEKLLESYKKYKEIEEIFLKYKNKNISKALTELEEKNFIILDQSFNKSKNYIYITYKFKNTNVQVKCSVNNMKIKEVNPDG